MRVAKGVEYRGRSPDSPERRARFTTVSGIPVERVYTPLDRDQSEDGDVLTLPGEYPFSRGIHASGYRGRLWTMRMFAGYGTAEETNRRFKYLLEQGQTGLSVAFDMPTLYGYDTDHPMAKGEFGRCGVAVSSLADMEALFDGIPLDKITTSMTVNAPAAIIWAMYLAVAEMRGISFDSLGGTIQNDILKEYIAQNEYIFPVEPSMRLVVDTIEYSSQHLPKWNPVSISGYHIREAGATAVQELAFTLADGFEYVKACLGRAMDVDQFAPRLSFFFNVHQDFFEEIAKFRAARRIWAREMRERFGAKLERSCWLRTHAQTAGVTLTSQQPENNIVRVALQAVAAALGGVQSLHTNAKDEAWSLPAEEAALLALRTQQIVAHETGVTDTIDPLGGSYYLEWLTDRMEEGAYDYFRCIEEAGGVKVAVEDGYFVREIADSAHRYQREVESKERVIVGVNEYITQDAPRIPALEMDAQGESHHLQRLDRVRSDRDNQQVAVALRRLREAAATTDNLMPHIIEAVKAYATLGETMQVLREEWGEYQPSSF